jgi:glycosyltransferase involved in cell wall biosynthesis
VTMYSKKLVVVSAVNLVEGGTLKVLLDCLDTASRILGSEWRIIALVHQRSLVPTSRVECVEFPSVKGSWFARVCLEWFGWRSLSRKLNPDLWLSMHDITPSVKARRQAVYCHNSSPFYKMSIREALLEPKLLLFTLFYRYLYRVNISRNHYVVVQQEWLRAAFKKIYPCRSVVVAYPTKHLGVQSYSMPRATGKFVFLYPALSRVFKNFEVICQAVESLEPKVAARVEVRLTIDGSENRYARTLIKRFGHVTGLRFIGLQRRDIMKQHYAQCHALLFPSRLESWGLPISEAKIYGKPLLVADLPYAYEAVGSYEPVVFIAPRDVGAWTRAIVKVIDGRLCFDGNHARQPEPPFAADWTVLWRLLVKDL